MENYVKVRLVGLIGFLTGTAAAFNGNSWHAYVIIVIGGAK